LGRGAEVEAEVEAEVKLQGVSPLCSEREVEEPDPGGDYVRYMSKDRKRRCSAFTHGDGDATVAGGEEHLGTCECRAFMARQDACATP